MESRGLAVEERTAPDGTGADRSGEAATEWRGGDGGTGWGRAAVDWMRPEGNGGEGQ